MHIVVASVHISLLQNMPLFQAICPGCLWARDNRWLLSRVQRLAGPAGDRGHFIPVEGTNRDKSAGLLSRLMTPPETKGDFLSRVKSPPGTKSTSSTYYLHCSPPLYHQSLSL